MAAQDRLLSAVRKAVLAPRAAELPPHGVPGAPPRPPRPRLWQTPLLEAEELERAMRHHPDAPPPPQSGEEVAAAVWVERAPAHVLIDVAVGEEQEGRPADAVISGHGPVVGAPVLAGQVVALP